jgi:hypothetical protein
VLAYQWQRDGVDIAGAINPTYATPILGLGDSGAQFRVRVSNGFGSVFSSSATVTVNSASVVTWTGAAGDGNWFNSLNWSPATVPTSSKVVQISSGSVAVPSSASYAAINLSGGSVSATFTLNRSLSWTGGTLAGDMTIASGAVLTIGGSATKVMSGAVLRNGGTVIWNGSGSLRMDNASSIENLAGGVFNAQNDATMYWNSGTAPVFNNAGTFRKSASTGTTSLSGMTFNNSGTVDVTSGTANFSSNNLRLQPGSQLTGAGRVIGSVTLNGNVVSQSLELVDGSALTGTGTLSGTMIWTGGTLAADLTLAPGSVLAISSSVTKVMSGAILRNRGTVSVSGTGSLRMDNASSIQNLAGGVFDVQSDKTIYWNSGTAPTFTNAGTLQVQTGILTFSGLNPVLNTGTRILGAGRIVGTLQLNGNLLLESFQFGNGMVWQGTGTVQGTVFWTEGTLAADVTMASGSAFTISSSVTKVMSGAVLRNGGTVSWSGTGSLRMDNASRIENLVGGVFNAQSDATMYWNSGTAPVFNNAGTFRKSASTGTSTLSGVNFTNSGTIVAESGTLSMSNGLTQTAGQTQLAGGSLSGGTMAFNGGSLSGNGTISAFVTNGGQISPGTSPGTLTISGNYAQSAAGVLNIEVGGLAAGSQFDRLIVTGTATLNGAIQVGLINGFVPSAGNSFQAMTFASRSGNFTRLNGSTINANLALTGTTTNTNYTLTAATAPFLQWQTNQFGANAGNPLIAGPGADPDGDSIVNWLEYGLGLNPNQRDVTKLPTAGVQKQGSNAYLTLKYRQLTNQPALDYNIGVSGDLQAWDWTESQIEQLGPPVATGDGLTEEVTVRVSAPIGGVVRKFLRLRVNQVP